MLFLDKSITSILFHSLYMLSVEYVRICILSLALKIIPQGVTNGYPASPVEKYLELIRIIRGSPAVRVNWQRDVLSGVTRRFQVGSWG